MCKLYLLIYFNNHFKGAVSKYKHIENRKDAIRLKAAKI